MNKRRFKRAVLLTGLVSLLLVGALGLSMRSYRRQETLNRQLIAALEKQTPKQAMALVNAGADPNTPVIPPPPPLIQLWNHLLYRKEVPRHGNPQRLPFNLWRVRTWRQRYTSRLVYGRTGPGGNHAEAWCAEEHER